MNPDAATPTAHRPEGMNVYPYGHQDENFPLVIEPESGADTSEAAIREWLQAHRDWVRGEMTRKGAVVIRGFKVDTAAGFERCLMTLDDGLQSFYWGTSPRLKLTDHVFTASELPWYYVIPQHCEMSFLKDAPRRIYFHCMVPPGRWGETPLVDYREVYRQMQPAIRDKFEDLGLRYIRNYFGPEGNSGLDATDYKRWDDMFQTTDRSKVEELCQEREFTPTWKDGGRLQLVHHRPAIIEHPDTGEKVWFNHANVFHTTTASQEMQRVARRLKHPMFSALALFAKGLQAANRFRFSSEDQPTHVQYGDGTEIPDDVMNHIRDLIWRNMVMVPWKKYDMVLLDNYLVSHGRRPFFGDRVVAVAWG